MVKKKCDLPLTTLTLPPFYPTLDIIHQLTCPPPNTTVCLNIAPQYLASSHNLRQVDVFETCVLGGHSLVSAVPAGSEVVIVNDLSFWTLYSGVECVYKELLALSRDYKVISSIVEGTMESDQENTILLLSDVIINLIPSSSDAFSGTFTESVRQQSGRTESTTKTYHLITSQCPGVYKLDLQKIRSSVVPVAEEKKACDVTFEMGLSEREKSARATTVLPYTAAAAGTQPSGADSTQSGDRQQGDIHYVPEDEDDWDDEDPDDDLDI